MLLTMRETPLSSQVLKTYYYIKGSTKIQIYKRLVIWLSIQLELLKSLRICGTFVRWVFC